MDKYYDSVYQILRDEGETGVSVIAKKLDMPVSTLQKYLERQSYFKKTIRAKWDLPERVTEEFVKQTEDTHLMLIAQSLETQSLLIGTQFDNLRNSLQMLISQTQSLKPVLESYRPPVADKSDLPEKLDKRVQELIDSTKKLKEVFGKRKEYIPDIYKDVLFNFDYVGLVLKEGVEYTKNFLENEIYNLLTGSVTELPEDAIGILKENQLDR